MILPYVPYGVSPRICLASVEFSSVCASLLLVAVAALLLKSFGFKGAPVFVAACIAAFISRMSNSFAEITSTLYEISSYSDIDEYAEAAMKVVGIGYLSGISSDICREIGEVGVARCIGVVSKLELIAIASPFIKDVLSLSLEMIGG